MENSLEVRNKSELESAIIEADNAIMKKYMNRITHCEIKDLPEEVAAIDPNSIVRINKVDKLVFDAQENNQDKLMNVYNAVGLCGGSIINIIISDGNNVEYYIGTRASDINGTAACQATLTSTFNGNFPGTTLVQQKKSGLYECIGKIFGDDSKKVVSFVSGIPGYKDEDNKENSQYIQGIERVIDAMKGQRYAIVTISIPQSREQISKIRDGYESMYSQLSPFSTTQLTYSESDSNAVAESFTTGLTKSISESVSNTVTNSTSATTGTNISKSVTGTVFGTFAPMGIGGGASVSVGKNIGTSNSNTVQNGTSKGNTSASSVSDSETKGKTDTYTNTSGRSLQITMENRTVKNMLDKIDKLIERISNSEDLGLWSTATYCIADDSQTSRVLGNSIEALCRGREASIEAFAVDTWVDERRSNKVQEYLRRFLHPEIILTSGMSEYIVNPTSLVNGMELVIEAGLPQKSVPGVPVSEMISFSRNVVVDYCEDGETISLGKVSHMGAVDNTPVNLDVESLTAHTLITGSTGSGKSNTVYHILEELKAKGIKFLVVEPAKGEYKHVFGNEGDVTVYGTNEKYNVLLRINPFKFPKSVHVLEHIDRLIEIFNVCWPMYAAMPAVLKDAILCAYESCGWNLEDSVNAYGNDYYPTFRDLQRELNTVINQSAYSDEVKGNYTGSLTTRVKSLTNGINGKIFRGKELPYEKLFDENVIVDLSRVGSIETKSLIMGILVMALNEYRMDQSLSVMNQKMKHITVLEEAHNLLRNTSSSSGTEEGGNIAGKSVEMITNSIAEMRTYGEGFIIVDQSPSAIDVSAIRNTNTKIIMRLPEENDRKQVGKSAALKDGQIDELAKLHRGAAVVYQNNWLDPVLCAIDKASVKESVYVVPSIEKKDKIDQIDLFYLLMKNRVDEKIDFDLDNVNEIIRAVDASTKTKLLLMDMLDKERNGITSSLLQEEGFKALSDVVVELLDVKDKLHKFVEYGTDCSLLQQELDREINRHVTIESKELRLAVSQCIMKEIVEIDNKQVDLYSKWREYAVEQRKFCK